MSPISMRAVWAGVRFVFASQRPSTSAAGTVRSTRPLGLSTRTTADSTSPEVAHGRNVHVLQMRFAGTSAMKRSGDVYVRGYTMGSTTKDTSPSCTPRSLTVMPVHGDTSNASDVSWYGVVVRSARIAPSTTKRYVPLGV